MTPAERRSLHDAMVRFADGERAAFDVVFTGLWPLVLAVASRGLPDPRDAEDAAQTALLKVFARIVDLDRGRDGVAWAVTVTAWEVRTLRKRRTRSREGPLDGVDAKDADDPEATAVGRDLLAAVSTLVGDLSPLDQAALASAFADEENSDGTMRKRRQRALARLRDAWRRFHG
jgi:DNA-directed RNA polymerase specialized sigma24 family protein